MSSADMAGMLACVCRMKCGFTASAAGSGWYRLYNNRGRENPHISHSTTQTHTHTHMARQKSTHRPIGLTIVNQLFSVCVSEQAR